MFWLNVNAALKLVLNGVATCLSARSISYCTTDYCVFHSVLDFHHDRIKTYLEQLSAYRIHALYAPNVKVSQVVSISGKRNMATAVFRTQALSMPGGVEALCFNAFGASIGSTACHGVIKHTTMPWPLSCRHVTCGARAPLNHDLTTNLFPPFFWDNNAEHNLQH